MISKDKINLQLSVKKEDLKRLEQLTEKLSKRFCISLTKSQAITFLINFYLQQTESQEKPKEETKQEAINKKMPKPFFKDQENKELLPINLQYARNESRRKLLLLKDALQLSHREMAEKLQINFESFRGYIQGKRLPSGENAVKIEEMYGKYGIF